MIDSPANSPAMAERLLLLGQGEFFMPLTPSFFHSRFSNPVRRVARRLLRYSHSRKLLCFALVFNFMIIPSPAIVGQLSALASTSLVDSTVQASIAAIRLAAFVVKPLLYSKPSAQQKETLEDRIANVAHIQISPRRFVAYLGQAQKFSALPTNYDDQIIQGVRFSWESSDPDKVQIDDTGQARFLQPGRAFIICRAGATQARIPVIVRPSGRPWQSDQEWRADQESLPESDTPTGTSGAMAGLLPSLLNQLTPTASAQSSWPNDFGYDELWTEPRNLVGSPLNRVVEATRAGSVLPEGSNFEFAVPLFGLGGRGLGTNLTLYYNSRVWTRRNNAVAFDAITGWPGPGFSLGFGRLVFVSPGIGSNPTGKYMLVDPDGTRHYLGSGTWMDTATYETSDGSHIRFIGNARYGGTLKYKDGTTVMITPVNNRLVPTQIFDTNGNLIDIAYKPDCYTDGSGTHCGVFPPASIDYITDTLGRIIQFQYDANGKLTSITTPGFGGTAQNPITQTIVQFDYQTLSVSHNFSGLTVEHVGGNGNNLRHVYFPATNTGYKFTYSGYGMIYNLSMRRSMTISGSTISDGTESASVVYNYPTSGATQQTDVPAFTQRTENATNASQGIYTYSTSTDSFAQTKTFTMTQPDSSTVNFTRSTNSSSVANGLLVQLEVKTGSSSLGKSVLTYANDGGGSPQVQSIMVYDDNGTTAKLDFDYDANGNVTNKREYGYQISGAWQVRRRTHWSYTTIGAAVNLVTEVDVYDAQQNTNDADDVLLAKTTYAYDNYASMGGMEDYGGAQPPGHSLSWGTGVTTRGNVTGISRWTDLQANTSITHLAKYDIFGNVVKAQVSCCQEKDFTRTDMTYWSQPDSVTSGDINGVHETTSADYDFNTSLPISGTNAMGLTTTMGYNAAFQPSTTTLPTGVTASGSMNYATLTASSTTTYDDGGTQKTLTTTTLFDGWGQTIQNVAVNNAQVNTAYDAMGRMTSRTNPFTAGGTPGPATTIQYDLPNKAIITTLPDSNTVRRDYSGNTVTTTDQVNRKIKHETDSLGRLMKVTEQDSSGTLSQETGYSYNLLNHLMQVNQGNQLRSYNYDALGRLLYERIPEQTATINDGTGTMWSSQYTYTEFSAIATKQDARGVVTTYSYDSLHRLIQTSYNTVTGVTTAPNVTYTYDTDGVYGTSAPGQLMRVNIGTDYQERYTFDSIDRIASVIKKLGTKTYTTSYQYNEASQMTQLTYPSTRAINIGHDSIGRVNALTGYLSNMSYNVSGQVSGLTLGNGVSETYGYDANRLQMTSQTATKSGTTLISLTYSYQASAGQMGAGSTAGNAGQLMSISGTINGTTESASYTYDNLERLTTSNQTSNGSSAQRRFAYDRWGNRTGMWDAVSGGTQIQSFTLQQSGGVPTNRISSVTSGTTVSYTYDNNGNVTNDGVHAYTYDSENRLVSVDSGATASYAYDAHNRRYKKTVGGTVTHYVWEGNEVLAEHNGSTGAVLVDYIYSGSRMIAKVASGTTNYFLNDRLSMRLVLNTSGSVVGRQAHLPFGEDFAETGTQMKQHFTSYERDSETGTDYAVNRQYNQTVGRFLRVDLKTGNIASPQSLNRYIYTKNDPVNKIDPTGLEDIVPGKCYKVVGDKLVEIPCEDDPANEPPGMDDPRLSVTESYWYWGGTPYGFGMNDPFRRIPWNPDLLKPTPGRRPCPESPNHVPEGVDIDKNIAYAKEVFTDIMFPSDPTVPDIVNLEVLLIWFIGQVKPGGPWDYKRGGNDQYENFGNFHYGAVGAAIGLDKETLVRAAGWVQAHVQGGGGENSPGFISGLLQILLGAGGEYPHGDERVDSEWIKWGAKYYRRKFVEQDCD